MPAPRANRLRATRAPEGASIGRRPANATYRAVPLWPGIFWGHDSRCSCSWAFRDGAMQVKVRSGACTVHIGDESPLPELLGQVVGALADALEEEAQETRGVRRRTAKCGTPSGYNRHWREGTETCPACRQAKRGGGPKRKPGSKPSGAAAEREAA